VTIALYKSTFTIPLPLPYLKRTCSRVTSASSALRVLNDYALYKFTHSLAATGTHVSCFYGITQCYLPSGGRSEYSLLPPEKLVLGLAAGICRKTELAKDAFKVSKTRHKKIENKPHFHCSPSQPNTITIVTILSVYSALCENVTSSAKPEVGLRSALYYRQRKTELQSHQSHYSAPDREAGYCDERVCLCVRVCVCVCLSVYDHIFGTTRPIFMKFFCA